LILFEDPTLPIAILIEKWKMPLTMAVQGLRYIDGYIDLEDKENLKYLLHWGMAQEFYKLFLIMNYIKPTIP